LKTANLSNSFQKVFLTASLSFRISWNESGMLTKLPFPIMEHMSLWAASDTILSLPALIINTGVFIFPAYSAPDKMSIDLNVAASHPYVTPPRASSGLSAIALCSSMKRTGSDVRMFPSNSMFEAE